MTLDELKTKVDRDLNEARLYMDGKQETPSEHNMFKFLTYSKVQSCGSKIQLPAHH